jgi:hypothetical protein
VGLKSWHFVGICRISAELPHSTELVLRKPPSNPNGFRQSFRARATLRTPDKPGSPPVLRTSSLSLLYKERTWEHYRKLNLTFFTPSAGRSRRVFIGGVKSVPWPKLGIGRPTCQVGRPHNLAGQPSFVAALPFPHWIPFLPT